MSDAMTIVITDAGLAEVVNAEQSGTAPVVLTHIAFGTGQYTPTADRTALQAEFKRMDSIAGGGVGDNIIHITANDNSTDSYTVYEVGVFSASGTLFAVYSQTTPILQKAAASEILLAIDILITQFSPESVTIGDTTYVLPPATTVRQGIVELATPEEVYAQVDSTRAITPSGLATLQATTSQKGMVELATLAEVIAGTDGTRVVTTATLKDAFVKSHAATGFQKLINGLIIQWGKALVANGTNGTSVTFPTTFPSVCTSIAAVSAGTVAVSYFTGTLSAGSAVLKHNGNGGVDTLWIAVGY